MDVWTNYPTFNDYLNNKSGGGCTYGGHHRSSGGNNGAAVGLLLAGVLGFGIAAVVKAQKSQDTYTDFSKLKPLSPEEREAARLMRELEAADKAEFKPASAPAVTDKQETTATVKKEPEQVTVTHCSSAAARAIADDLYTSTVGLGTRNKDYETVLKSLNKDNIIMAAEAWDRAWKGQTGNDFIQQIVYDYDYTTQRQLIKTNVIEPLVQIAKVYKIDIGDLAEKAKAALDSNAGKSTKSAAIRALYDKIVNSDEYKNSQNKAEFKPDEANPIVNSIAATVKSVKHTDPETYAKRIFEYKDDTTGGQLKGDNIMEAAAQYKAAGKGDLVSDILMNAPKGQRWETARAMLSVLEKAAKTNNVDIAYPLAKAKEMMNATRSIDSDYKIEHGDKEIKELCEAVQEIYKKIESVSNGTETAADVKNSDLSAELLDLTKGAGTKKGFNEFLTGIKEDKVLGFIKYYDDKAVKEKGHGGSEKDCLTQIAMDVDGSDRDGIRAFVINLGNAKLEEGVDRDKITSIVTNIQNLFTDKANVTIFNTETKEKLSEYLHNLYNLTPEANS